MMLMLLLAVLVGGGVLAWWGGQYKPAYARWTSMFTLLISGIILLVAYSTLTFENSLAEKEVYVSLPWIPVWGISLSLGLDGLSFLLSALTLLLGGISLVISWNEITYKTGFYYLNLLWILAGITGVFLARDLFLFYFFWELMLVPMYFLISIWGHENRKYAAYKFFIYTQLGGLLMLLSILALYFIHGSQQGVYTFDFDAILATELSSTAAPWILGGFLAAFLIKLPVVPLHNWLPDAHTEAPTAGSVILAGLLLKTGAYGLLRLVVPLFPEMLSAWSEWGMLLGAISILYGAKLAFSQTDLKRLVAYTSVSHLGFVILGISALNAMTYQGIVVQLVAHGLSTGALFIIVGMIQKRTGTRDIRELGGLWTRMPYLGGVTLLLLMASLGLPGLANFVAEFLILAGTYSSAPWLTALAAVGLILSSVYALRMMQAVFYGKKQVEGNVHDLNLREGVIMGIIILLLVAIGLYPKLITQLTSFSPDLLQSGLENEAGFLLEKLTTNSGKEVQIA